MPKATWNGKVIAETDAHEIVEGNVYFPREAVKSEYLAPSGTHTVCPWKGTASYFITDRACGLDSGSRQGQLRDDRAGLLRAPRRPFTR